MREIAVLGGTAHPALAAESCADLGVRCAAMEGLALFDAATGRHGQAAALLAWLGRGHDHLHDQPGIWCNAAVLTLTTVGRRTILP